LFSYSFHTHVHVSGNTVTQQQVITLSIKLHGISIQLTRLRLHDARDKYIKLSEQFKLLSEIWAYDNLVQRLMSSINVNVCANAVHGDYIVQSVTQTINMFIT